MNDFDKHDLYTYSDIHLICRMTVKLLSKHEFLQFTDNTNIYLYRYADNQNKLGSDHISTN